MPKRTHADAGQLELPATHPQPDVQAQEDRHRHQELDRLCKSILARDQGRVLRWICTPDFCRLVRWPEVVPQLVEQLDKDFAEIKRAADYLLKLLAGPLEVLLHWEFQKRRDAKMGPRVHRYQGAARETYGHQVVSLVLLVDDHVQTETMRLAEYPVGPLSQTGWIDLSLRHLVAAWTEETDSPMAEMLRALVVGRLDLAYLRSLLERLQRLGLSEADCRNVMLMLSFLLAIREGQEGHRYKEIIDEVLTMLQLEDSWIYQRALEKGKAEDILTVLATRGVAVNDEIRRQILSCTDKATLDRWLRSAVLANSAAEVVGNA